MAANFDSLNKVFLKTIKNKNKGAISAVIFDNEKILYSFYDGFIDKNKKLAPQADSLFMNDFNSIQYLYLIILCHLLGDRLTESASSLPRVQLIIHT